MVDVGNLQAKLGIDTSSFTAGLSAAGGALNGLKAALASATASMTALLANPIALAAAAIAALVAVGKAAYDAYVEIDKAYDAIEIGTGATGEALEELKTSFDNVFANATYVENAEALAGIIADLNTYLGATGSELEGLATQFSNLAGMGMDASVDSFSQSMNKWGIEAQAAGEYLDYFFRISQNTGITIDELTQALTESEVYLKQFGFSMSESADLIGSMSKAGFNTSTIQTAFRSLISNGITTKEQFEELVKSIQNATDSTEALSLAQAFGTKNTAEMVDLIRNGGLDNLSESYDSAAGAINETAASTEDFSDKMERAGRRFTEFGAQAGDVINAILRALFDANEWLIERMDAIWAVLGKFFSRIGETFAKFWNEGEDDTGDAVENILGFIEGLINKVAEGLDWFLEVCWPAIEIGIQTLVTVIKLFAAIFAEDWQTAFEMASKIAKIEVQLLYNILNKGWEAITNGLQSFLQGFLDAVFSGINAVVSTVQDAVNGVITMVNGVIMGINAVAGMTGISLDTIGTVSWNVQTPQIPNFASFSDTGIGQNLQAVLDQLDLQQASGQVAVEDTAFGDLLGLKSGNNVTLVQNFNSEQYDYYEVTRAGEDGIEKIANSTIMRY